MGTEGNAPPSLLDTLEGVDLREAVRVLLKLRGYRSNKAWAESKGRHAQQLDFLLSGARENQALLDLLVAEVEPLGVTREWLVSRIPRRKPARDDAADTDDPAEPNGQAA